MNNKIIRNVAAISLVALFLGIIFFVISGMDTTTSGAGETSGFLGSVSFFAAVICLFVCGITGCIGYFGALIKAAQLRRMKWFVGILLFGVVGALVFGLVGPEKKITNESLPAFLYGSYKETRRTMGFK